ncbi:cytochrome o ubiquinol oxidase operon protein cyoD [Mycoplana sp. BE70]|uniref:cytochrome o ubiquinol oxidase subunit IV n=1 Tax=Mycoplana sp. BE70 TaxID=2817775 RepID=UPI0028542DE0|nr:cytochrome o ubiquinol oxidase subunit IV [Mycoplana sp. BE70]MDR6758692.1 cytochrome o ubiquinol oxidase operon protein cyoD [Mycoplana sp. BE70]
MSNLASDEDRPTGILDDREDHSPGDEPLEDTGHWVRNANLGLTLSILLTVGAFLLAGTNIIYGPSVPIALIVLAIAQMGVHLVFFLHITTGPDNTNNVLALAFGVLVVFLIVIGSIWIMDHLMQNMSPTRMEDMMQMQP